MTPYEIEALKASILSIGLWKLYLVAAGLFLVFFVNVVIKKKGKMEKMAMVSSGVLFLITVAFIILASI